MLKSLEYEIDLPKIENDDQAPHEVDFQIMDVYIREKFEDGKDKTISLSYFQLEILIAGYVRFKKMQQIAEDETFPPRQMEGD